MNKRLLKLSYAIVVVSVLFTQYGMTVQTAESATASFSITYASEGNVDFKGAQCTTFPEEAKPPFEAAANIWANIIQSPVPIAIYACWADLGDSSYPSYSGGFTFSMSINFPNAPFANTWCWGSLANALAGSDMHPDYNDMHITYNLSESWYYGTDGNTPSDQLDLMTVALHEIAHGLNFSGLMFYSEESGRWGFEGCPNIFDTFMRDGSGNQLIDTDVYPNPSTALGDALTGKKDGIWFHGSNAMAANDGMRVRMYAPPEWIASSYEHLNNGDFNSTVNGLMTPGIPKGVSTHDPGPVTIGLLQDLGWQTLYSRSAIDGFNPNVNDSILSIAVQGDGKILIGGEFTKIGGVRRNRIARLNVDGTLDVGFNPDANRLVRSIALQADGKILLGGLFSTVGGVTRNRITRLNADGTLDTDFSPDVGPNATDQIYSIAVQADGKLLIGGVFTSVSGVPRNRIARLNADGTIDADFIPDAISYGVLSSSVLSITLQSGGGILIGGAFTSVGGVPRNYMARLNADGSLDTGFNAEGLTGNVSSIALQADSKILIGGDFTSVSGVARRGIARLYTDGSLDNDFNTTANSSVYCVAVQADGKVLIGGYFISIGEEEEPRNHIARLNADGTLDDGFNPNANTSVRSIALQADGKILIGGDFTLIGGVPRNYIARLYADGSLDNDFNADANGTVRSIAIQANGKILIGGNFTSVGGVPRNYLARLNADGSLDTGFIGEGINSTVYSIAVQADDKILVGGNFTKIGIGRNYITRLKSDGSLDTGFNANANGSVYSIAVQADNQILVGGTFTSIGGGTRHHIARLNTNGTLDPSFIDTNASEAVLSIAVQADDKILVGGWFTYISGGRNFIARLNQNGTLDDTFNPNANATVRSIAVLANGRIVIGGDFTTIGVETKNYIAMLYPDGTLEPEFSYSADNPVYSIALQADRNILIGGLFSTISSTIEGVPRHHVARFYKAGVSWSLDSGFTPHTNNAVYSIALQADGKILVGGDFTSVGGQPRNYIARLTNTDAAIQDLSVSSDGTSVTWMRWQASPEVWRVSFEHSSDGVTWTSLGNGIRISRGWQLTGLSLPFNENHYVRARGYAAGGMYSASGSLFESVRMFFLKPLGSVVDFDGDRKSDISVWRPGDGYWYIVNSKDGSVTATQWGSSALNDVPVPGDYDGDGKTDIAIWRPGDGYWYIVNSKDGSITATQWGAGYAPYNDLPVPADYDGDGKTDIAIWRPGGGYWYIINSKNGSITATQWGAGYAPYNDVPVPGDYDGDGKTDIAIWRAADGYWYIINSKDGSVTATQWGSSGLNDVLVPGDYDGDKKTDIAVWRPGEGYWYIINSKDGSITATQWGAGYAPYNDIPVPGDYDGDGKTDIAIWRAADGYWYIISSEDESILSQQWGAGYAPYNDEPISQRLN